MEQTTGTTTGGKNKVMTSPTDGFITGSIYRFLGALAVTQKTCGRRCLWTTVVGCRMPLLSIPRRNTHSASSLVFARVGELPVMVVKHVDEPAWC